MLQVLFRIPGLDIPIYGYGLMMVIGFLVGVQVAKYLCRRTRIDPEVFVNAAILALVSGVIGARLSHVLENFDQYTRADRSVLANLWDAINLSSGGLTFYGGLLLATPICILYALKKKVPLGLGMDIIAICLMIGLGFGRIGCFLNGCCHGAECDLPFPLSVQFPEGSNAYVDQVQAGHLDPETATRSLPVHPAQLYSALNAFLIAAVCFAFFTIPHAAGRVFALMLVLKGITRFLLEMIRTEPPVLGPLSISMVLSIGLVVAGIVMWYVCGRINPIVPAQDPLPSPGKATPAAA